MVGQAGAFGEFVKCVVATLPDATGRMLVYELENEHITEVNSVDFAPLYMVISKEERGLLYDSIDRWMENICHTLTSESACSTVKEMRDDRRRN